MKVPISILPALFLMAISPAVNQPENTSALDRSPKPLTTATFNQKACCLKDTELSSGLIRLSAPMYQERATAEKLLRNVANKSVECRKRVIVALMEAMDTPDHNFTSDQGSFDLWQHGSNLLADLKATEALDLLITHLELKGTNPLPFNHNVTMHAVIKMGWIAIPKLSANLRRSPDPYLRRDMVFCIASIGGTSARKVLSEAFSLETDKCVKSFILTSLHAFSNKKRPNYIASEDRLRWSSAFFCPGA